MSAPTPIANGTHVSVADKVATQILEEANLWKEAVKEWSGIFSTIYTLFQGTLKAIVDGNRKKAIQANSDLFALLDSLRVILAGQPFGNPATPEELAKAVAQIERNLNMTRQTYEAAAAREKLVKNELATALEAGRKNALLASQFEQQQLTSATLEKQNAEHERIQKDLEKQLAERRLEIEALGRDLAETQAKLGETQAENAALKEYIEALKQSPRPRPHQLVDVGNISLTLGEIRENSNILNQLYARLSADIEELKQSSLTTPSTEDIVIPPLFAETLDAWRKWESDIIEAIRALSEHIEDSLPMVEEARAHEAVGLAKNGDIERTRRIEQDLADARRLAQNLVHQQSVGGDILRQLERFADAITIIKEGLDETLLQKPEKVPDIADLLGNESFQEERTDISETSLQPRKGRREIVSEIAEEHHLSVRSLFFISLYELLRDTNGRPLKRGQVNVIFSAFQIGLLEIIESGCAIPHFFEKWEFKEEQKKIERYLLREPANPTSIPKHGFTVQKDIFQRTEKPLSWEVSTIFSSEEIRSFLNHIKLGSNKPN